MESDIVAIVYHAGWYPGIIKWDQGGFGELGDHKVDKGRFLGRTRRDAASPQPSPSAMEREPEGARNGASPPLTYTAPAAPAASV